MKIAWGQVFNLDGFASVGRSIFNSITNNQTKNALKAAFHASRGIQQFGSVPSSAAERNKVRHAANHPFLN